MFTFLTCPAIGEHAPEAVCVCWVSGSFGNSHQSLVIPFRLPLFLSYTHTCPHTRNQSELNPYFTSVFDQGTLHLRCVQLEQDVVVVSFILIN